MLPQLISLWPSEHTGTTRLPVGEEGRRGARFPVLSRSKGGREGEDRRAPRHESQALHNLLFRSRHVEGGGMFIDLSHTHIVKRNFGTSL